MTYTPLLYTLIMALKQTWYIQHAIFTFPCVAFCIGILLMHWLRLEREARQVKYAAHSVTHYVEWNAVHQCYVKLLRGGVLVRKLEMYSFSKAGFSPVVIC
jgi:hypothetical protein